MNRSDLPSLDDLRAFETVARLGSVRAAANELALTHGAVSRRISKLAADLDIKLFARQGRGLRLTANGERLARSCKIALNEIRGSLAQLRTVQDGAPIILSCERSVAMRWLIPRLSEFQDQHPEIPIHLSVGGGSLEFARDGIVLAIRRLDFQLQNSWNVDFLMPEQMGPILQHSMKKQFLAGEYIGLGAKTRSNAWRDWLEQHPKTKPPKEIRFFDHHFLMAEAAAAGLGVAICPKVLAKDDIDRGRIIAPLGFKSDGSEYGLLYPKSPSLNEQSAVVRAWILGTAKQTL